MADKKTETTPEEMTEEQLAEAVQKRQEQKLNAYNLECEQLDQKYGFRRSPVMTITERGIIPGFEIVPAE